MLVSMPAMQTTLFLMICITCVTFVTSRSDPADFHCSPVCEAETNDAVSCEEDNGCDIEEMTTKMFLRCSGPCWIKASACQRMCRNKFEVVYNGCDRRCQKVKEDDLDCVMDCFVSRMKQRKVRYYQRLSGKKSWTGYNLG